VGVAYLLQNFLFFSNDLQLVFCRRLRTNYGERATRDHAAFRAVKMRNVWVKLRETIDLDTKEHKPVQAIT
jgi:hypothetical protein